MVVKATDDELSLELLFYVVPVLMQSGCLSCGSMTSLLNCWCWELQDGESGQTDNGKHAVARDQNANY